MSLATLSLLVTLLFPPRPADDAEKEAPAAVETTAAEPSPTVHPTLEEIFQPPRLLGQRPRRASISADGRFCTYEWAAKDEEKPKLDVYVVPTAGGEPRKLFAADDEVRTWWTQKGARLLVHRDTWLELHDAAGERPVQPIFEVGKRVDRLHFLEDGRRVAFSAGEDHQVWIVDLETGERRAPAEGLLNRGAWFQILEPAPARLCVFADPRAAAAEAPAKAAGRDGAKPADGKEKPADGKEKPEEKKKRVLYLVPLTEDGFEEETRFEEGGTVDVSADGRFVRRTKTETSVDRKLVMADYLTEQVSTVPVRSSLPGDSAGSIAMTIYDIEREKEFTPPLDEGRNYWNAETTWSSAGSSLLVERLSNDFHVRQILILDPSTRRARLVFVERDDAWVGGPLQFARWTKDDAAIVFTSEQSGFNHLYRYDVASGETTALTDPAGRFEVGGASLLEDGRTALIVTNETDPAERNAYAVDLASGARRMLSTGRGVVARPRASHDATAIVYEHAFLGVPSEVYAARVDGGGEPVRLTRTIPAALADLALPPPEIVEYENTDDGTKVRAYLYRPAGFDPAKKYPAVMFIHGAGYLQNVLRSMSQYDVNMLFHHRLARRGYVVIDPDYRHSQGYGRKFRADVHGFMGGKDLDDAVFGVKYLESLGFVDVTRVGIYGGSYGGFMTLMALFTKPDVFACGAALRSVTDWRTYNSWYTNARLGDPKKDEENYKRSSPIEHVDGLKRPLLILHGLKDSNVFAQDSIRLIEKLIELGKDFDAMLYPSQDHGFADPDSWVDEYKRIERLFDRHLRPE